MNGLYETIRQSFGDWIPFLVLMMLFYIDVLVDCGLVRRISLWFITRKVAKKSPWSFTFMFFLSTFVLGLFLDVSAFQLAMFALAIEIFAIAGLGEEDKYVRVLTTGITLTVMITFVATPFTHSITVALMGIFSGMASGMTGSPVSVNWISFMGVSLPICILIWLVLMAFMRFVANPDVSKLKNLDYSKIESMRPGPMEASEKFIAVISVLLVVSWVLPGILSVINPNSGLAIWFDQLTMTTPVLIALLLFAVIRFDGKPILDLGKTAARTPWFLFFFLTSMSLVGNAIGEPTTGIAAWMSSIVAPMLAGLSPYAFVTLLAIICCIITNVANNMVIGIVFLSVGIPLSLQAGINPAVTAVAITLGVSLAFTLPSAFLPIAYCFSHPLGGPKYTFRYGVAAMVISIIFLLLAYPLGLAFL